MGTGMQAEVFPVAPKLECLTLKVVLPVAA